MHRGIYSSVSAMLVQQSAADCASNNLANVDTAGFRRRKAVSKAFPEVLMERIEPAREENISPAEVIPIGGLSLTAVLSETVLSTEEGKVNLTGNDLDVAIAGKGYFTLQDDAGNSYYSRAGRFIPNSQGQLVTPEGVRLVGDGGPVEVGEASSVMIDSHGNVVADGEAVAKVSIVEFANPSHLRQMGGNLLQQTKQSGAPAEIENVTLCPHSLEHSNVNVVQEMANMIEAHRAYEAASKCLVTDDDMTGRMISALGKSS